MSWGIQSVVFAWLVTMVMREPAERVGTAQMALLLPGTLLILIAGATADRVGLLKQAITAQLLAAIFPCLLALALFLGMQSFGLMIVYALFMGCFSAFLTPARDGLLSYVADGDVQKTVMQATLCQFGFQIIGYSLAGFADQLGAETVLIAQGLLLLLGVAAYSQLKIGKNHSMAISQGGESKGMLLSLREGARTVIRNPLMRIIVVQNIAMGCFFMGAFIVCFPLVIREVYDGSSSDLALMSAFNSLGLVVTILVLLRVGFVARAGKALILAQIFGSLILLLAGWVEDLALFIFLVFVWGICGGTSMPMSRTLMQQLAPPEQVARVMSFYAFSFMGAGPIGALFCGYMSEYIGPQATIMLCAVMMFLIVLLLTALSPLWTSKLEKHSEPLVAS